MRYAALLAALALSCAADLVPLPDAASPADAGPCGGACGAGTVCEGGACMAVDAGAQDAAPVDAGGGADVVDAPAVDLGAPDAGNDSGPADAGFDAGPQDSAADAGADAACAAPSAICNGACVSLESNTDHCGRCNSNCPRPPHSAVTCVAGACGTRCAAGFADCDGDTTNGCEAELATSFANCGACGAQCAAGRACSAGACIGCALPEIRCAGRCIPTSADPANCGACEHACGPLGPNSVPGCQSGVCVLRCDAAHADCDGLAANGCESLLGDRANCGGCGTACAGTLACVNTGSGEAPVFQCGCASSALTACANGCVNTQTNGDHCGACGHACGPTQRCNGGACESCGSGSDGGLRVRCGSECVDLQSSELNCGACGNVCSGGRFCGGGTCRN